MPTQFVKAEMFFNVINLRDAVCPSLKNLRKRSSSKSIDVPVESTLNVNWTGDVGANGTARLPTLIDARSTHFDMWTVNKLSLLAVQHCVWDAVY